MADLGWRESSISRPPVPGLLLVPRSPAKPASIYLAPSSTIAAPRQKNSRSVLWSSRSNHANNNRKTPLRPQILPLLLRRSTHPDLTASFALAHPDWLGLSSHAISSSRPNGISAKASSLPGSTESARMTLFASVRSARAPAALWAIHATFCEEQCVRLPG